MRTPRRHRRLRALLDEARRRKVHRTLTIYAAVMWGAIASAPDLFQYLGVPSWAFPALVLVLVLGLPVVLALSWTFDFSLQEEEPPPPESGPVELLTPRDVERKGLFARYRLLSWILPLAAVAAVSLGIRWLISPAATAQGLVVVLRSDASESEAFPMRSLQQPLEWLAGASVLPSGGATASLDQELDGARQRGAGYLIVAQTTRIDSAATLSVTLYDTGERERLLVTSGGGAAESLETATGRISLQLARFIAEREGLALAVEEPVTTMTSSPVALSHLLEGQRRFAATDFDAAAAALRRAIESDPGFVPAYYRLAIVERWRWNHAAALAAVDAALALDAAPPRWEHALRAQRFYLLRQVQEAISAFEQVTLHYPELREGWLGLGEALFHYGGAAGHRPEDSRRALERALADHEPIAPVGHHLAEFALWRADSAAARHSLDLVHPAHPVRASLEIAFTLQFGTPEERAMAWASLEQHDLRDLSLLVAHFAFDPTGREKADSVASHLLDPDRPPEDRLRGAQYRLVLASSPEEWEERLATWRSLARAGEFDPWIVHAHHTGLPTPEARAMLAWADQQVAGGRIPDFRLPLNHDLRRAFNALVHEAVIAGDSATALGLLSAIESAGSPDPTDPAPEVLSAALRSRLALLSGDTARAVQALGVATSRTTEPFVAFYPTSTMAPERLLLVRLARATGQDALAERWSSSFYTSMSFGDLLYQSWAEELRVPAREGSPSRTPGGHP